MTDIVMRSYGGGADVVLIVPGQLDTPVAKVPSAPAEYPSNSMQLLAFIASHGGRTPSTNRHINLLRKAYRPRRKKKTDEEE